MRRIVALAAVFAAAGAWAQERYTNADLDRIYVKGAFTNEDLNALPPIETPEAPALPLAAPRIDTTERDLLFDRVRALEERREMLARELAYEDEIVRQAYAPGGNSPDRAFFVGQRSKSRALREELRKEIALTDRAIEDTRWQALRAPVTSWR